MNPSQYDQVCRNKKYGDGCQGAHHHLDGVAHHGFVACQQMFRATFMMPHAHYCSTDEDELSAIVFQ